MAKAREKLLSLYDEFPFHRHPLWEAIRQHDLTKEQVLLAETQHYLRTRAGRELRRRAAFAAPTVSATVFAAVFQTFLEECTDHEGPDHLTLILRLLRDNGVSEEAAATSKLTPGNSAAIALYGAIGSRGPACHIVGAGAVEWYYAKLCPEIFEHYTTFYGFTSHSAETYYVHGPLDEEHAERALAISDEAIALHGEDIIFQSVRDAFVATSLHYDGMLQAARGRNSYWEGSR